MVVPRGARLWRDYLPSTKRPAASHGASMSRALQLEPNLLHQLILFPFLLQAETDGTVNAAEHNIVKRGQFAWLIEAAVSVLSDSIIMSRPGGGPKIPQQAGNWDED